MQIRSHLSELLFFSRPGRIYSNIYYNKAQNWLCAQIKGSFLDRYKNDFERKKKDTLQDISSLVPRRSLLIRCPLEVWERAGKKMRYLIGNVTAHDRVQEWRSWKRLGTRLGYYMTQLHDTLYHLSQHSPFKMVTEQSRAATLTSKACLVINHPEISSTLEKCFIRGKNHCFLYLNWGLFFKNYAFFLDIFKLSHVASCTICKSNASVNSTCAQNVDSHW